MTRRVRFTPLLAAGIFAATAAAARAEVVPFAARPPVSTSLTFGQQSVSADFDRDGDADLVAADGAGFVQLFRNAAGDGSAWTPSPVATLPFGAASLVAADLDGDGDADLLARDGATETVRWYENAGVSPWPAHGIVPLPYSATSLSAGDLDRDGDLDVLAPDVVGQRMRWFENAAGDGTAWTVRTIATAVAPSSAILADLDDDGDPDVVAPGTGALLWFENTAGNGSAWTTRTFGTAAGELLVTAVDLDRDGDLDLVAPTASGIGWFENVAGNASAWTRRPIATAAGSAFDRLTTVDLDADGDPDLLVPSAMDDSVRWYENAGGDASAWVPRTIATDTDAVAAVLAEDLDADGDLDVVALSQGTGTLGWFRNETIHQNACFVPRTIATGVLGAQAAVPADVDGDGDLDAVSTAFLANAVLWHDNTAGDASAWVTRTIATGFASASVATAGDVDRDGDVDVAAIGAPVGAGTLAWFDNTAGDGSAWTQRTVSTAFDRATHVELSDVSGDGDLDLLGAGYYSTTRLFENATGNGSAWTPVTLPTGAQTGLATGDLDGDGDLDVTSTESFFSDGLSWTENTSGTGATWSEHTIATAFGATYAMATADMDGDGDLDVLEPGANFLVGTIFWYENVGGGAASWAQHGIPGAEASIAAVGDLDRDGDVDVVAPGTTSDLRWWENTAGTGLAWSQHGIAPIGGTPRQLAVADLDRDGDADLLAATASTNAVDWYENRGGQAAIAVVDQAPATANNGDLVPMLRATVTHLGRAGDGTIELASLGLLFEESAGDPLTSAEANALVESLRVYRDANGNGVFEPATDVLVTSVTTLTLTGGVATVAFADGDANAQVAAGTPRSYFVVAELAATASGQVPNQFRVTLLQTGALRSVVEDRTFDLPLRLACPADVSSTIRQVVPVELTGFTVE
jgi:hypothetical protein